MVKKAMILAIVMCLFMTVQTFVNAGDPLNPDDTYADGDKDGLSDIEEYLNGSDPNNADSDNDGIPDGWEVYNDLDPKDPTDAHKDGDYVSAESDAFSGEIDALFNAMVSSYDVWPSDGEIRFDADKHYDNYEEYWRLSEWKPDEITGLLKRVELYAAKTDPNAPDTDGDLKLDPDDAAPTYFDNDGTKYRGDAVFMEPGSLEYNTNIRTVDSMGQLNEYNSVFTEPRVMITMGDR